MFPSRVFDPDEVQRVLKDGHQSRKIGKFVTKGKMRGFPIFTLTLEERATCPRSCLAWALFRQRTCRRPSASSPATCA
jgi:hypothetical protein